MSSAFGFGSLTSLVGSSPATLWTVLRLGFPLLRRFLALFATSSLTESHATGGRDCAKWRVDVPLGPQGVDQWGMGRNEGYVRGQATN